MLSGSISHGREYWLRSPTVSLGNLSHPRSLGFSRDSFQLLPPQATYIHSFSWPSGLLSSLPLYLILLLLLLSLLSSTLIPPSAIHDYFTRLLSGIEASTIGPSFLINFIISMDGILVCLVLLLLLFLFFVFVLFG